MIKPLPPAPPRDPAEPPAHLTDATRAWWIEIARVHRLEQHQLHTLQAAAEAWDRKEQARAALDKHGLSYTDDRGMIRPRPEVSIERDSVIRYLRAMRELGLQTAPAPKYDNYGNPLRWQTR
jgi:P27 family predicted phage terminase small subunit